MTIRELEKKRADFVRSKYPYQMIKWDQYDYTILDNIMYKRINHGPKSKYFSKKTYNDVIIMGDTETSRVPEPRIPCTNIVVAWTISIRAMGFNWVTLYGNKPRDFCKALKLILENLKGDKTFIYFHNLAYDYVFLRRFLFEMFGTPKKQLATKPHYPICIEFENGLTIKDSLILAQVKLEKWAKDLGVEHLKAVGSWDYEKIRNQNEDFSEAEKTYIEHDTLAGVECIDKLIGALGCNISTLPYTATGILRAQIREIGSQHNAREYYLRQVLSYPQYVKCTKVFHGGYCHGNRYIMNQTVKKVVKCYDFTSSYPFVMLAFKYPGEKFMPLPGAIDPKYIIKTATKYAYMFRLDLYNVRLKDPFYPMPVLSYSKCSREMCVNAIEDNGRIVSADMVSLYCNETDLLLFNHIYDWDMAECNEVEFAEKRYLPRWFTDLIFDLFRQKQELKGIKELKTNYNLAKGKINSAFGCSVQRNVTPDIIEDYITGDYDEELTDPEKKYEEYIGKMGTILPYQWGTWVCSYAQRNLFLLAECINKQENGMYNWLYSDTDSIYASDWDEELVKGYNDICRKLLKKNGYGPITVNGKEYCLGIATCDPKEDIYTEFRTLGAKRYCGRSADDGTLHITISGVPKGGAEALEDDIANFHPGFTFKGELTGKLTHYYIFNEIKDEPYEVGDCIDLRPCDYELDMGIVDWDKLNEKEVYIQVYEE